MKKIIIALAAASLLCFAAMAQPARPEQPQIKLKFTPEVVNPITPVKNQASSGTCWAFSAMGFVESEIIRINNIKDESKYPILSVFYVVSKSYAERAEKYVRVDGKLGFSAGSEADDVLHVIRDYGIVPWDEMTGMNYGTPLPAQSELDAVLLGYIQAVARIPNRTLTTAWKRGFQAILDEYLGKCPETFTVDGKQYTPASYRDALKFNPDEYVSLTSFTHHPFYTWFPIEVADNWRWDQAYNVPIDELMENLDAAIRAGYTVAWGADVSTTGFTRTGYALLLDTDAMAAPGSDQARWVGAEAPKPQEIKLIEKVPTQESRQIEFDNKTMTDDHGMQIFGIARDENGQKYYMVKNSWGVTGEFDGIWYASEAFVKAQTLDIVLHQSAVSKDLKKKLGIK